MPSLNYDCELSSGSATPEVSAAVTTEARNREPLEFIAGSTGWPSIDAVFHAESAAMIAAKGISAWLGCGGVMGYDGRLTFGSISSSAFRAVHQRLGTGFLWTDDCGSTWAVFPPRVSDEAYRRAFAICWSGSAWVLDSNARQWATRNLEARMNRLRRPGRMWSQADRARYAQWSRCRRRLRCVDLAMMLLLAIGHCQGTVELTESDVTWLAAMVARTRAAPTVDEAFEAICAATELQVAELRLGRLGWNPRVLSRSPAVSQVAQLGQGAFRMQFAPLWSEAVAALSEPLPPEVAAEDLAQR